MTAVAICNDSPQAADGEAFAGCASVSWIDASELPTNLWSGVTMEVMSPVLGAILLLWAMAFGVKAAARALKIGW